jgi:hypothetical protein
MGYTAYVFVSLVAIPTNLTSDEVTETYIPKFKETYELLKAESSYRNFFSLIGHVNHIVSGGAEYIIQNIQEILISFTSKHPEFTFGFHFIYHDFYCIDFWTAKNTEIVNSSCKSSENQTISMPEINLKFTPIFSPESITIPNDITNFLNDNAEYENFDDFDF